MFLFSDTSLQLSPLNPSSFYLTYIFVVASSTSSESMKSIIRLGRRGSAPSFIPKTNALASSYNAPNKTWQRNYTSQRLPSRSDGLPELDASKLSITKNTQPKELLPPNELVFGNTFTGKSKARREKSFEKILTVLL